MISLFQGTIQNFHEETEKAATLQAAKVFELLDEDVLIVNAHGGKCTIKPGGLRIYNWSAQDGVPVDKVDVPDRVFGQDIYGSSILGKAYVFATTGGIPIYDGSFLAALVYPHTKQVILTFDALHMVSSEGATIEMLRSLFEAIVIAYSKATGRADISARIAAERQRIEDEKLVKALTSFMEQRRRDASSRISDLQTQLSKRKSDLISTIHSLAIAEAEMNGVGVAADKLLAKIRSEVETVKRFPSVRSVRVTETDLIIETERLFAQVEDRTYIMGEFTITLALKNGDVKFINKSEWRRKAYWHDGERESQHPHVNNDGKACLGNINSTIPELLGQLEIAALCGLLVNFLESVNPADPAGAGYKHWPEVDQKTGKLVDITEKQAAPTIPEGYEECYECGERIRSAHMLTCEKCGNRGCDDHITRHGDVYLCDDCE